MAAALILGGCDDDEEKPPEVIVEVEEGTEVRVRTKGDNESDMIIVGELALFTVVIAWALFGPGATRRREMPVSEHG
ncbi:MAG: hypothetical protein AAF543_12865 [Pseudomonadota bacterium]